MFITSILMMPSVKNKICVLNNWININDSCRLDHLKRSTCPLRHPLSWLSSACISFRYFLFFSNDMYFVQICIFINDSASNVPKGDTIAYYIMAFLLFRASYYLFNMYCFVKSSVRPPESEYILDPILNFLTQIIYAQYPGKLHFKQTFLVIVIYLFYLRVMGISRILWNSSIALKILFFLFSFKYFTWGD